MQYSSLGRSDLSVSRVCLGSMTWGIQNTQQDADEQIQYALEKGVNFIDTAEMYPVPPNAETYGDTERMIGDWLSRHSNKRKDIIIASKIAGAGFPYVRNASNISKESIPLALEDSLARLQTDYIDVYQLHWPNRTSPHFGKHWPNQLKPTELDVTKEREGMRGIVEALGEAINSGKIRHWGLSDDTPWGIHTYLNLCDELGVPRPVSIQNEFNLLHLKDWPFLIESCVYEEIAYLPWSPLAGGLLSGKYLGGARPEGSRWTLMQRNGLFRNTENSEQAVKQFSELAATHSMTSSQLALAWCDQVDGVSSTIIGATSMNQLQENIEAFDLTLSQSSLDDIDAIIKRYPMAF
ncbi:aldo/keto reductase [Glaciecola sp. SC05]|uniref:aldo/keto reductase n=1 Tax=Glaciecola sp. SC05 TaxID=1987355 RepID=UPI003529CB15